MVDEPGSRDAGTPQRRLRRRRPAPSAATSQPSDGKKENGREDREPEYGPQGPPPGIDESHDIPNGWDRAEQVDHRRHDLTKHGIPIFASAKMGAAPGWGQWVLAGRHRRAELHDWATA